MPGADTFDERDAREIASWLRRIEALLPPNGSVQAFGGFVTVCATEVDCRDAKWSQGSYAQLFDAVAGVLRSKPDEAGAARRLRATPWTVQVFASRTRSRADAMAAKIDESHELDHGYYVAGGFPAINPVAHVVQGTDTSGRVIWRVIVGSYLERSQAEMTEEKLQARGFSGFIRPL